MNINEMKIDRTSFENVDKWIDDVHSKEKDSVFLFLVGNKLDIGAREVTQNEAMAKANNYHCQCFETSAKTNINVTELFDAITEKLLSLEPTVNEKVEQVSLSADNAQTNDGGCY